MCTTMCTAFSCFFSHDHYHGNGSFKGDCVDSPDHQPLSPLPPSSSAIPQWLTFARLSGDLEEVLLRSSRDHTIPLLQLPAPLQKMIRPLVTHLRHSSFPRFHTLEYSNQDGVTVLLDGKRFFQSIIKLFLWEEEDLCGRLDLLLWFLVYHQAYQESLRPEFAADFNWTGRFAVRITQEKRAWQCPDCTERIEGGQWWCQNPICPSRARLCCCTGWTPPLILVKSRQSFSHEETTWHSALERVRLSIPAS